jgi:hypothetical protein
VRRRKHGVCAMQLARSTHGRLRLSPRPALLTRFQNETAMRQLLS